MTSVSTDSRTRAAARLTRMLDRLGLGPSRTLQEPAPPPIVCRDRADKCGALGLAERHNAGRLGLCCADYLQGVTG